MAKIQRKRPSGRVQDALWDQQKGCCFYCDYPLRPLIPRAVHYDHFTPVSKGGGSHGDNFVVACAVCNMIKGAELFGCRKLAKLWVQQQREAMQLPRDYAHWICLEDALMEQESRARAASS